MIPAALIGRKRDGHELSDAELAFFIQSYSCGEIPDYQMSAMAMAIYLKGMNERETATLTLEMLNSGTQLQWPHDNIRRVDKHSTGGLGDKTSVILAPLLAECGLQVPMLSGRGLGATGGTLDKLESIPRFRTDLSLNEIMVQTQRIGCVITGTTEELAPADRRLYALRDVTAIVPSIPLITASIMSKKLAESLDALVLDVKFGSGAFMKTREQAQLLADSLVQTGNRTGLTTTALITDMNQPLGRMCGNAVEIRECLELLKGAGPPDVCELSLALAARLLIAAEICENDHAAQLLLRRKLKDGTAFERWCRMVQAQGGDPAADLRIAGAVEITARAAGVICSIETEQLGLAIIAMGGGRRKLGDPIDHSVGLEMLVRIGDSVEVGQPMVRLFSHNPAAVEEQILSAIHISDSAVPLPLIVATISE